MEISGRRGGESKSRLAGVGHRRTLKKSGSA
jgi:hypothetical protein